MGFRDNLLRKIEINRLAEKVIRSINPADSGQRIDRESMRQLLTMGDFAHRRERDLDLFVLDNRQLLLLDNELKIYDTTAEDVALRKSPTIKEMISIRNAIKILNDKDVVVSRKGDTVRRVQHDMIDALDLSFTPSDIASMARDGAEALKNNYSDGVIEILTLFAELLGYSKAPKAFEATHHHIWGAKIESSSGERLFGPAVMLDLMHNQLKMVHQSMSRADGEQMRRFEHIVKGEAEADLVGEAVFEALERAVLDRPQSGE